MNKLPWDQLDGCNILVTGATGLIGSAIIRTLMAQTGRKFQIYACGRNTERAHSLYQKYWNDETFHFIEYDVTNSLECNTIFHYIIDAASNASPNFFAQSPVEVMMANILGVHNLMQYGINHGMRRFLYISTGEVYGQGDGRVLTEDYCGYVPLLSARSCYPNSKRAAETLCSSYIAEYGTDAVIVRLSHVYGPGFTEKDNRVYAQFIRNILRGEDIVMKSTGEQMRSWCYVDDCVSAIMYALMHGKSGEAYNVADGSSTISIKQLAEMIAEIGNKKVIVNMPSEAEKKGFNPVTKSVFSTDKIESLGWKLSEGSMIDKMRKTIEICQNNQ